MDNVIGQKYNRLTIIELDKDRVSYEEDRKLKGLVKEVRKDYYKCKCDCGTLKTIRLCQIKSGKTKSCGCLNREKIIERFKKENFYEIKGDIVIGWDYKQEHSFIIDKVDYEEVKKYSWHYDSSYGYFATKINKKVFRLHQLICRLKYDEYDKKEYVPDHVNRNGSDNRRCNIELKTYSDNNKNRSMQSNNKSGKTGVYYHKRDNKWRAYIKINRKNISLGYYDTFVEALDARIKAEQKYGFTCD